MDGPGTVSNSHDDLELGRVDTQGRLLTISPAWTMWSRTANLAALFGGRAADLERALAAAAAGTASVIEAPLTNRSAILQWQLEPAENHSIRVRIAPHAPPPDIARRVGNETSVGLALLDRDRRIRYANPAYARIFGRPRADLLGRRFTELLQRDDREWARNQLTQLLEAKSAAERVEYVIRRPSGEQRVIHVDQCRVELAEGCGMLSTIVDITHERHSERELTDAEQQLRDLMNTIPGAIFRFRYDPDAGYSLEHMSDGARGITGWGKGTDIANFELWKQHIPEEALGPFLDSIEESHVKMTQWAQQWPLDVPAGRIWVQAVSVPHAESDGVIIWNGLLFDITERKQTEERLNQVETDYAHFFDHTHEGMYISSPSGCLLDVNWPLVRMHRCRTKEELIERIASVERDWYVEPDAAARLRRELEIAGWVEDFHAEVYRAGSGETFLSSENARAVRDEQEQIQYIQGTVRDVTEQHLLERLATRRSEILEMIARGVPLHRALHEIAVTIEAYQNDLCAAVCQLYDGHLHVEAAPCVDPGCIQAFDTRSIHEDTGAIRAAIQEERTQSESEIGGSPLSQAMQECGYGEATAFPIFNRDGNVLGLLAVFAPTPESLGTRTMMLLQEMSHITAIAFEQQAFMQQLIEQAQYDPLTRLPNRTLLDDRIRQLSLSADRNDYSFAVLMLDLDDFKIVNDTLGHSTGDRLLREVSVRVLDCVRAGDTVARFGGDEFVIACSLNTPGEASHIATRIFERLQPPIPIDDNELLVRASIGISIYPHDGNTPDLMLQSADTAMYSAKQAGRNQYHYFCASMNDRFAGRLRIERQLRAAIEREELVLFFQPRVYLGDSRVYGAEVLLRWAHPEAGLLGPGEFLTVAEQSSLIGDIDQYVIRHAVLKIAELQRDGYDLLISINISARFLGQANFGEFIADSLSAAGVKPGGLELEITETVLMQNFEHASQQLRHLRALAPGIRIALDDFGSGYSSLQYLRQLPIDTLKIDRSFIADLASAGENDAAYAIVRTIVDLGHSLGLSVIAEGVETLHQLESLRGLRCAEGQGFWFSPAVDSETFCDNIAANRRGDALRDSDPTVQSRSMRADDEQG